MADFLLHLLFEVYIFFLRHAIVLLISVVNVLNSTSLYIPCFLYSNRNRVLISLAIFATQTVGFSSEASEIANAFIKDPL